jgi:GTP-binding protein
MVEGYLANRKNLKGLLLIMDVRRPWTPDETQLVEWAASLGRKVCVILNKSDKTKQGERVKATREILKKDLVNQVFCLSAQTGKGVEPMIEYIYEDWVKGDLL